MLHMKTKDSINLNIIALTQVELMTINGGTATTAYDAGHAAGAYIRKIIDGVAVLALIFI